MIKIGLIGGSGFEKAGLMSKIGEETVDTRYGKPSSPYTVFEKDGVRFFRLDRHGKDHCFAPHLINYRANMEGFRLLGVDRIIALASVGSADKKYSAGDIVLPDNGMDFTWGRHSTFFDSPPVRHIDLTCPFCKDLQDVFLKAAAEAGAIVKEGGVYACSNGPRLETAAEVNFFKSAGASFIGMTLFPEAALARELEICYLNVSTVTNMAAGIEPGKKLTSSEVAENGASAAQTLSRILEKLPAYIIGERSCGCRSALSGSGF